MLRDASRSGKRHCPTSQPWLGSKGRNQTRRVDPDALSDSQFAPQFRQVQLIGDNGLLSQLCS